MQTSDIKEVYYTEDHEWIGVNKEKNIGLVGITQYAANALGDVVYVELPKVGTVLGKGDEAAVVESVKAASEIYAPVGGKTSLVNLILEETPEAVNSDPEGGGYFFAMTLSNSSELDSLMDKAAYKSYCEGL